MLLVCTMIILIFRAGNARNFTAGKRVFEKDDYLKIAHDAKKDIAILRQNQIALKNVVFDTALAGYILNSTKDSYEYDDIAKEFLEEIYPSEQELLGKRKNKTFYTCFGGKGKNTIYL